MHKYKNVVLGGTFDHFHLGHKKLLEKAFEVGEKVIIGITSDEMVKGKFLSETIEKLDVRRKKLEEYLNKTNWTNKYNLMVINDIYGPTLKKPDIDAIVVSNLTLGNALKVNKVRKLKGLKVLKIIVVSDVLAQDGGLITSERIREGEIDRSGRNFQFSSASWRINFQKNSKPPARIATQRTKLILPENLREELRKPIGRVIDGTVNRLNQTAIKVIKVIKNIKPIMVITVGDIIGMSLIEASYYPDFMIVDCKSRRKEMTNVKLQMTNKYLNFKYQITNNLINDPGTINTKTVKTIKSAIRNFLKTVQKQLLNVKGEEDLLALPAILFAPLGSLVLYGQWNLGVVIIEVTEEKKREVRKLVIKFH